MSPKSLPCPFCERQLQIPLEKDGKIGCRQCHNVSFYNAKEGSLTPLSDQKRANSRLRIVLICLVIVTLLGAGGMALYFYTNQSSKKAAIPASTLEETKDLLKSLSE